MIGTLVNDYLMIGIGVTLASMTYEIRDNPKLVANMPMLAAIVATLLCVVCWPYLFVTGMWRVLRRT